MKEETDSSRSGSDDESVGSAAKDGGGEQAKLRLNVGTASGNVNEAVGRRPARLFIQAIIGGSIAIFLGAVIGLASGVIGNVVAVIGPLVAMLLYLRASKGVQAKQAYADGFYYLGFSFTLIGLAVSFGMRGGFGQNFSSDQTLAVFSMSLLTTVVGLIVRTAVSQESTSVLDDTSEVEAQAHEFAMKAIEAMAATQTAFQEESERLKEGLRSDLAEVSDNFSEELGKAFRRSSEKADSGVQPFVRAMETAASSVGELSAGVSKFNSDVDGAALAVVRIEESLGRRVADLEESLAALNGGIMMLHERLEQSAGSIQPRLEEYQKQVAAVAIASEKIASHVEKLSATSVGVPGAMQSLEGSLEGLSSAVVRAEGQVNLSLQRLQDSAGEAEAKLSASTKVALESLDGVIVRLSESLDQARASLEL